MKEQTKESNFTVYCFMHSDKDFVNFISEQMTYSWNIMVNVVATLYIV